MEIREFMRSSYLRFDGKIPWESLDLDQMEEVILIQKFSNLFEDYPHFQRLKQQFGVIEKAKKKKKGMSLVDVTLMYIHVLTRLFFLNF